MQITKAKLGLLLTGITAVSIMFCPVVTAADKVVVIPLFSSKSSVNEIPTVTSAGQVWMDRNLGAERVAGSSSDSLAYGWLYQWGRPADGHESRTSPVTTLNDFATGNVPGHGNFIIVNSSPYDWRNPQNDNLWQGAAGVNNPCPAGFRLPTETELENERQSWVSDNAAGAFSSPLKLVVAGCRSRVDGAVGDAGSSGYYWSATVGGSGSHVLFFIGRYANMLYSLHRAHGCSVRCLKD